MKYAVDIPNFGVWSDPGEVAEFARRIEDVGWDGLSIWDHIIVWDGAEVADPWISLAAAATVTERITLMPMVTPIPRRHPWKLARETVSMDLLSQGRFILGVGLGWPTDPEFTRFHEEEDLRTRADMLDEGLAVLTGLWSGEAFSFEGNHYQVEPVTFLPTPIQKPRIPIWVAGMWPKRRPFQRAACWDGVAPIISDGYEFEPMTPEVLAEIVAYIREYREIDHHFDVAPGGAALDEADRHGDYLAALEDAGATWWREGWIPGTAGSPEEWLARVMEGPPRP